MTGTRNPLGSAGIVLATTVGAGMFGLPFAFREAGWLTGLLFLGGLATLLTFAHANYLAVLARTGDRRHLVGLAQTSLGHRASLAAFLAGVGGLLLSLVVYVILADGFVRLVLPEVTPPWGAFAFWLVASYPLFLGRRLFEDMELVGAVGIVVAVIIIFFNASHPGALFTLPAVRPQSLFLPFGTVLFALAGWTAMPAVLEHERTRRGRFHPRLTGAILGTAGAALLYFLFVLGITGAGVPVTEDTISGLASWSPALRATLGVLGLLAIWTSYVPIAREVRDTLAHDTRSPRLWSTGAAFLIPMALFALGLDQFLPVVGLAGGVFLSAQYILILLVARKVLRPTGWRKIGLELAIAVFTLAVLYEIYHFILG